MYFKERNPPTLHKTYYPSNVNPKYEYAHVNYIQCIFRCKTLLIVCLRLRHVASARVFPVHLESAWFCIPLCQWCAIRPHMPGLADGLFLFLQTPLWTSEPVRSGVYHSLWAWEKDTERERQEECGKWCLRQCYILSSDVLKFKEIILTVDSFIFGLTESGRAWITYTFNNTFGSHFYPKSLTFHWRHRFYQFMHSMGRIL